MTDSSVPTAYQLFFQPRRGAPATLPELERLFFSNVILRNGTFKTTHHRRLDDLNALVNDLLPPLRPLRLMDVAVSSGVSTAEWIDSLDQRGVDYLMVAGDLTVDAYLISAGFELRVLVDDCGFPLQFDVRGLAVRRDVNRRGMMRRLLPLLWMRLVSAMVRRGLRQRPGASTLGSKQRIAGFPCQPLRLISAQLKPGSRLEIVKDDILADAHFRDSFHAIRAANILNRVYFSDAILCDMLRNLRRRLKAGGLLVVCRTLNEGGNHGTVFRLEADGSFKTLARLQHGSEIEDLVLALTPQPCELKAHSPN